jgi:hypothetical protein
MVLSDNKQKWQSRRRYRIVVRAFVSVLTIMYAHSQKIENPNNLKLCEQGNQMVIEHINK